MNEAKDRRVRRTKRALIGAFNHLLLHRRRHPIRAADIIAEAKVGRSTFYDHYSSPDDVMLEALQAPFATLADAATGQGDQAATLWLLDHFWENRQRAREMFDDQRMRDRVSRLLAGMIAERLAGAPLTLPSGLAAAQLADAALAPVRAWVRGEAAAMPEAMADSLCRTGAALRTALIPSSS
jgi:AcrR family transcriptional regulator